MLSLVVLAIGIAVSSAMKMKGPYQIPPREVEVKIPFEFPGKVMSGFSYSSCATGATVAKINSIAVGPNPIILGENITVAFSVQVTSDITAISASVTLEKQEGIWIEIPCVDNIGSCTYDDVCSLIPAQPCQPPLSTYDIPCQCPIAAGSYTLPTQSVKTQNPGLSWLTNGNYYAKVSANDQNNNQIACLEVYATLSPATDENVQV